MDEVRQDIGGAQKPRETRGRTGDGAGVDQRRGRFRGYGDGGGTDVSGRASPSVGSAHTPGPIPHHNVTGRSSGSPSSSSADLPTCRARSGVGQIRLAYSSGGCAGMVGERVLPTSPDFPFHLPRRRGVGTRNGAQSNCMSATDASGVAQAAPVRVAARWCGAGGGRRAGDGADQTEKGACRLPFRGVAGCGRMGLTSGSPGPASR